MAVRPERSHPPFPMGAAFTVGLLVLAACGAATQAADPVLSPSPSAPPVATPAPTRPAVPLAPLTGLPAVPGRPARPAMAAIIGVTAGAAAPGGLSDADIVYEEYAEGGLLRLVAVFHSRDAAVVGPIISTRPTDPRVLEVFHGCLGYAGGSTGFVKELTASGVCQILSPSFTSTARLYGQVPRGRAAPPPAFVYAEAGQGLAARGVTPARALTVKTPGSATQTWTYDITARLWRSTVGGAAVSAASVVVLTMTYRPIVVHSPLRTLSGAAVFGQGAATVVSGAQSVKGSWYRPSPKTLVNVVDGAKQVVHLAPGRSWVLFAPTGSSVVVR